ncbi:hypothetical protein Tco_0811321 [Tanacetum coccineum]
MGGWINDDNAWLHGIGGVVGQTSTHVERESKSLHQWVIYIDAQQCGSKVQKRWLGSGVVGGGRNGGGIRGHTHERVWHDTGWGEGGGGATGLGGRGAWQALREIDCKSLGSDDGKG